MRLDILHLFAACAGHRRARSRRSSTLSLTLGAGAAIFAVVDAVVLTPPPFANPEALVIVRETPAGDAAVSLGDSLQTGSKHGGSARQPWRSSSHGRHEPHDDRAGAAERVSAMDVTPDTCRCWASRPWRAAASTPATSDSRWSSSSHAFWTSRLGGDPGAIGGQIVLGSRPHTIVGFFPRSSASPLSSGDLWRPLPVTVATAVRTGYRVSALARLGRGATAADLSAALDGVGGARRSRRCVRWWRDRKCHRRRRAEDAGPAGRGRGNGG